MKSLKIALFILFGTTVSALAEVSYFSHLTAEAEAENAAIAKEEAMTKAQRQAFLEVAGRLTDADGVAQLDKLTDEQLQHFILEVSVLSEKNAAKGYQAELNIEINGSLLKQYMLENNMIFGVSLPVDVVIVPVYVDNVRFLWEQGNLWRQAFTDKGQIKSGNLNFRILPDIQAYRELLPSNEISDLTPEMYRQIAENEKTEHIFLVTAVRAGRNTLVLIIKSYPAGTEKRIPVFVENASPTDQAVADTVAYIAKSIREKPLGRTDNRTKIAVSYEYPSLKAWIEVEKKLKQIPQIESLDAGSIGQGQVTFELDYAGSYKQLQKAMAERNLTLSDENGKYTLR